MVCKIRDVIPKTGNLAFPLWRCWTKPRLSSAETSHGPDWYLNASNCSLFLGDKSTIWIPENKRLVCPTIFFILTSFNLPGTVKMLNLTNKYSIPQALYFSSYLFFFIFANVDQSPLVPLKGSPLLHPSPGSQMMGSHHEKIVTNGSDISISEQ